MDLNSVSKGPVHNRNFYFNDDPMAIFLVENQLFKVHCYFFIEGSEVFRDMFTHAGGKEVGGATEGSTDGQPITLPDVTVQEFEVLLRFFYATTVQPTPNQKFLVEILAYSQEEKFALLSIAHRFNFSKIFQYIIKEINVGQMLVLDRIRLGDKYNLNDWLFSAYKGIINHSSKMEWKKEEADVLGLERLNKLLMAKNFILHEQLEKSVYYENSINSYIANAPSCNWCRQYFGQFPHNVDEGATTSTETIVKKYFPSN